MGSIVLEEILFTLPAGILPKDEILPTVLVNHPLVFLMRYEAGPGKLVWNVVCSLKPPLRFSWDENPYSLAMLNLLYKPEALRSP